MSATVITSDQTLTAAEAEAVATSVVLHHLRAAQAAASSSAQSEDKFSPWAREALLTSVDKELHRVTAWGVRSWG
jgi:hypothetical protein